MIFGCVCSILLISLYLHYLFTENNAIIIFGCVCNIFLISLYQQAWLSCYLCPLLLLLLLLLVYVHLIFFLHPQAKERICKLIQNGVDSGARLVLDGRNIVVLFICFMFCSFYLLQFLHNLFIYLFILMLGWFGYVLYWYFFMSINLSFFIVNNKLQSFTRCILWNYIKVTNFRWWEQVMGSSGNRKFSLAVSNSLQESS